MLRRLAAALLVAAAPGLAQADIAIIAPDTPLGDSSNRIVNTRSMLNTLLQGLPLAAGTIFIGNAGNFAQSRVMSGDCSISSGGILTCTQSAGNFKVNGTLTVTGDESVAGALTVAGGATVTGTLTVNGAIVDTSGGLTLGNPIGGSKGSGTANASVGYYVNGVLLPIISASVPLSMSMGGTGGSLIPSPGGIVYTDAFGMRVLPSPFPGKFLRSGFSAPNWTQTTWSDTYPAYSLLYANGPNNIQALAPGTDGQLNVGQTNKAPSWNTMSGDCTISAAGAISCTKTGGVAFTGLATASIPLSIANGGTNATSATNARVNLATVGVVKVQKFTANGTYTPSTGILYAIVECLGAGGAGGGVAGSATGIGVGGGGGAGSRSLAYVSAATLGVSQTVTIGAGGTAGAAGANAGNAGGDTSLGALCVGKGGGGGGGQSAGGGLSATGGSGGVAGTGDVTGTGSSGSIGLSSTITTFVLAAGQGASSPWGGGGLMQTSTANGLPGALYGAGGGGGYVVSSTATVTGGAGSAGLIIVTEFTNQ